MQRVVEQRVGVPRSYMGWDPLFVRTEERNRTLSAAAIRRIFDEETLPVVAECYKPDGLTKLSHTRMLVSDGPYLLRWLGLFREEPFTSRDEQLLESIAPTLAERLAVERVLSVDVGQLLEHVLFPAFLVSGEGRIVLTNEAGGAMLNREPSLAKEVIEAARGRRTPRVHAVVDGRAVGMSRFHTVLLKDTGSNLDARVRDVGREHRLTIAERRVLERIVNGDPNKDVAMKLGIAPRTVEVHVSAILSKCRVETRARLIAWFWTR